MDAGPDPPPSKNSRPRYYMRKVHSSRCGEGSSSTSRFARSRRAHRERSWTSLFTAGCRDPHLLNVAEEGLFSFRRWRLVVLHGGNLRDRYDVGAREQRNQSEHAEHAHVGKCCGDTVAGSFILRILNLEVKKPNFKKNPLERLERQQTRVTRQEGSNRRLTILLSRCVSAFFWLYVYEAQHL